MSGVGGKRCITNNQATTSHYLTRLRHTKLPKMPAPRVRSLGISYRRRLHMTRACSCLPVPVLSPTDLSPRYAFLCKVR